MEIQCHETSFEVKIALNPSLFPNIYPLFKSLMFSFFRYGPCQTPTLGFCVQRYLQISTFKPEKFWVVLPYIIKNGFELKLEWDRNRLFDHDVRSSLL